MDTQNPNCPEDINTPEQLAAAIEKFYGYLLCSVESQAWAPKADQYAVLALQAVSSARAFAELAKLEQAEQLGRARGAYGR